MRCDVAAVQVMLQGHQALYDFWPDMQKMKMPDGNGQYSHWGNVSGSVCSRAPARGSPATLIHFLVWLSTLCLHTHPISSLKNKTPSDSHPHAGEELKTQSDIITTSCYFPLPWSPAFAYFQRLVGDESAGLGPFCTSATTNPYP